MYVATNGTLIAINCRIVQRIDWIYEWLDQPGTDGDHEQERDGLVSFSFSPVTSLLICSSQKSHETLIETSPVHLRCDAVGDISYLPVLSVTCPVGAVPHGLATWLVVADGGTRGISRNRSHTVGVPVTNGPERIADGVERAHEKHASCF